MRTLRFVLTGLGNVGRPFLEILHERAALMRERYRLELVPVGLADSGGAAVDARGLDIPAVLEAKRARRSVATLPGVGRPAGNGRAGAGARGGGGPAAGGHADEPGGCTAGPGH